VKLKDFTIIIPCISFKDVKNCLKNIRKNYSSVKIIVSLNKNFKKNNDRNLKIIVSNHKGIGKKRNIAVDECKTKYLAFLDSDAYPAKNWLESSLKYLKKKNVGIVTGPHVDPPNQSYLQKILGIVKKSFLITMMPQFQKEAKKKPQFLSFIPSCNWILRKKVFNQLKQMDNKMLRHEDWDFVYTYLPEHTLQLENHFNNMTNCRPVIFGYDAYIEIPKTTGYESSLLRHHYAGLLSMNSCGVNSQAVKDTIIENAPRFIAEYTAR